MLTKGIIDEDFANYKKPSMFIASCNCDFKCCSEANIPISVCQNQPTYSQKSISVSNQTIYDRYTTNSISQAIVFGGLEWLLQFDEMLECIKYFREHNCHDDIVIYTGYYPEEIQEEIEQLKVYDNIIVKFGRFKPNQIAHYDKVLGIDLISDNQWAEKIS